MEVKPLDREKSKEFLRKGFRELGVEVDDTTLERTVSELDGIIGWLVYLYGGSKGAEDSLREGG